MGDYWVYLELPRLRQRHDDAVYGGEGYPVLSSVEAPALPIDAARTDEHLFCTGLKTGRTRFMHSKNEGITC